MKGNDILNTSLLGYSAFQIITSAAEATYDNVLQFTINGSLDDVVGNYSCSVSNTRATQELWYVIQGKEN